jgi:hypothetical protein
VTTEKWGEMEAKTDVAHAIDEILVGGAHEHLGWPKNFGGVS